MGRELCLKAGGVDGLVVRRGRGFWSGKGARKAVVFERCIEEAIEGWLV